GPGGEDDEATLAAWRNAERGIDHIRREELLQRSSEDVLRYGFSGQGEDVRVFRGSPGRFEGRCSPQRVAGVLRAVGCGEVRDVLREQGAVTVTCEFCQRPFRYDAIDIEALFTESPDPDSPRIH